MLRPDRQQVSTFLIDPESGAEMVRLTDLHKMTTQYMGGLFPQSLDIAHIHHVLDLACGPGDWVQDMAFEYPDMEVIGIASSQALGRIVIQALQRIGRSYSSDGQHHGTLAVLVPFLHDAGLVQVQSRTYEIPFTAGPISLHPIIDQLRTALYLMEPALLSWEVVTHKEFEALLRQMELESIGQDFRGTLSIEEAWGEKAA